METKQYILIGVFACIAAYFVLKQFLIFDWSEQFLILFGIVFVGGLFTIVYFMKKEHFGGK